MPLSDRACAALAHERSIRGWPRAILDLLAGRLGTRSFTVVSIEDLASELEVHHGNVSRSVRKLVDLGVLIEGPKHGRSRSYRIDAQWPPALTVRRRPLSANRAPAPAR